MFRIESEQDLLRSFRPRDRQKVELPEGLQFPLFVRDYLSWVEPAGTRVYLVLATPGSRLPVGIAFRRDGHGASGGLCMCDWCHTPGSAEGIGMLTTDVSSKRRVGVNLCLDLRCKDRLETEADLKGRHPQEFVKPLLERMRRFTREALHIDVVPES